MLCWHHLATKKSPDFPGGISVNEDQPFHGFAKHWLYYTMEKGFQAPVLSILTDFLMM